MAAENLPMESATNWELIATYSDGYERSVVFATFAEAREARASCASVLSPLIGSRVSYRLTPTTEVASNL